MDYIGPLRDWEEPPQRPRHYTLIGQTPVPCDDILEWAAWFEIPGNRIVRQDNILWNMALVSTVFLGIDHNFTMDPEADAILFETMVFWGDGYHQECVRAASWLEAEYYHKAFRRRSYWEFRRMWACVKCRLKQWRQRHEGTKGDPNPGSDDSGRGQKTRPSVSAGPDGTGSEEFNDTNC